MCVSSLLQYIQGDFLAPICQLFRRFRDEWGAFLRTTFGPVEGSGVSASSEIKFNDKNEGDWVTLDFVENPGAKTRRSNRIAFPVGT